MTGFVDVVIEGKTYQMPVIIGSEGEKAFDITKLRDQTGYITHDPGFGSTGSCSSSITYMDGDKGILRYRGIPIEQLAKKSSFVETAYLLINGILPSQGDLNEIRTLLNDYSMIHENMQDFFKHFPRDSHPMGILSAMVGSLRSFYPEMQNDEEAVNKKTLRLISKIRTLAAMSFRISRGNKVVYPRHDLSYCANFLNMMFDGPVKPYTMDEDVVRALNVFWILHADHEQNCSTAAVRVVGSAQVNLYASISAGIAALWGPRHGGANMAVIRMLEDIAERNIPVDKIVKMAKDKNSDFRLMGFGHRVYKTFDPRAVIMKEMCDIVLKKLNVDDPLLDIAKRLEEAALTDPYFIEKNLYPNVDFYSGIILRAIGIPTNMFTVMFAIGRLPGWISQWIESTEDPRWKIARPRQIYTGNKKYDYIPIEARYI